MKPRESYRDWKKRVGHLRAVALLHFRDVPDRLLATAYECLKRGDARLAVVLAQTACEVMTEAAIDRLLRFDDDTALGDALADGWGSAFTLSDQGPREFLEHHARVNFETVPWFARWREARQLRRSVCKARFDCSPEEAAACVEVAVEYISFVEAAIISVGTARGLPDPRVAPVAQPKD